MAKTGAKTKHDKQADKVPRVARVSSPITAREATISAVVLAAGVGLGAALFRGWGTRSAEPMVETDATLAPAEPAFEVASIDGGAAADGGMRAPDAFRPDRDAPVEGDKRAAFAPATIPVPSRTQSMGNGDDD